jgi:hypothetical protein
MDISETTRANSAQQNYDDFLGGQTRTVTITAVTKGTAEQPVSVELAEYPGHPFLPNKSMRRVLLMGWGKESSAYVGRRLRLFGNPAVIYGGKAVGGVEIEAMSHIDKQLIVPLTVTRGRRKNFTVAVLKDDAPTPPRDESGRDWPAELLLAADDIDAVRALGAAATQAHAAPEHVDAIRGKWSALKAAVVAVGEEVI